MFVHLAARLFVTITRLANGVLTLEGSTIPYWHVPLIKRITNALAKVVKKLRRK